MSYVCASGRWLRLSGLGKLQIAPPTSTERLESQQVSAPPSPRVLALPEKSKGWPTETPNQHLNLELNRLYSVDDQLDWNLIDILTDGTRSKLRTPNEMDRRLLNMAIVIRREEFWGSPSYQVEVGARTFSRLVHIAVLPACHGLPLRWQHGWE